LVVCNSYDTIHFGDKVAAEVMVLGIGVANMFIGFAMVWNKSLYILESIKTLVWELEQFVVETEWTAFSTKVIIKS